jgi:hypothetical protein
MFHDCTQSCRLTYRGYVLDVRRLPVGWRVSVQPRRPDLPILRRSDVETSEPENALAHVKQSIDQLLNF